MANSLAERIEQELTAARVARRSADRAGTVEALERAAELADRLDSADPLARRVVWKLAKARADAGNDPIPVLAPLFEEGRDDALSHYPNASAAAARAARFHQDHWGYRAPTTRRIWARLAADARAAGATVPHLQALLQLAWDAACRGDRDTTELHLDEVLAAEHDALTLDAHHTRLRAAVWRGDLDDAERACATLERLTSAAPDRIGAVVHEARLEFAVHAGRQAPPPYPCADPFRDAFQRAMRDRDGFDVAVRAGRPLGPEWALAAWLCAGRVGVDVPGGRELAERSGCAAFLMPR